MSSTQARATIKSTKISELRFLSFNVEGLESMLLDPSFYELINNHDICILQETMRKDDSKLNIENFWDFSQVRPKKQKIGRHSGGITILIRENLREGIKIAQNSDGILWFRLLKAFFHTKNDLYICGVYVPPHNSPYYTTEYFDKIIASVSKFTQQGDVIMCGDFNSRIGKGNNCQEVEIPHLEELPLHTPKIPNMMERSACDQVVNQHGKKLIQICDDLNLHVANGRVAEDQLGNFTCYTNKGSSTVDLVIGDSQMIQKIRSLKILPPEYTSVHSPVSFRVNCNLEVAQEKQLSIPLPPKIIWDPEKIPDLREALTSPQISESLRNITTTLNDPASPRECIDESVRELNRILVTEAKKCMKVVPSTKQKPTTKKQRGFKWYSEECTNLKTRLKNLARLIVRNPKDPYTTGQYNKAKKLYRKTVKQAKRMYEIDVIQALQNKAANPKEFWSFLKKVGEERKNEAISSSSPGPEEWLQHFTALNATDPSSMGPVTEKVHSLNKEINDELEKVDVSPSLLVANVGKEELENGIKALKLGKAVATDLISNEIIKTTADLITPLLMALFSKIIKCEIFPEDWSLGIIIPLFKSGDTSDPNCYRGITINSCLAKLFMLLMNSRLQSFCDKHGIIHFNQIGFTKGFRPGDHVFTMKTLIDKSFQEKKTLHVCFVDFRKAYDTVWRDGLYKKLLSLRIDKSFVRLLRNIYSSSSLAVKTQNGRSKIFSSRVGLKQGCNLSPLLFNLFINDLLTELQGIMSGSPTLEGIPINALMYADDLVLISETEEGLQSLLDTLQRYTDKWFLQVNKSKTKYMRISNSDKNPLKSMKLGDTQLEATNEYCYLGTIFSSNGSLNQAAKTLHDKASKAMFSLLAKVNKHHTCSPKLLLDLFDKMILPIAMYNVEVWGTTCFPCNKNNNDFLNISNTKNPIEALQVRFCKRILAVNDRATNWAVLSECGRFPTIIKIMKSMISFWDHLANSRSPILKAALQTNANLSTLRNTWYTFLRRITRFLDMEHILYSSDVREINLRIKSITRILHQKAEANWLTKHHKTQNLPRSKMDLFCKIKTEHGLSNYLESSLNFRERRALSKFRISAHNLPVETGRYKGIDDRNSRICPLCNTAVGDEAHYLIDCSFRNIVEMRHQLYTKISNKSPNFSTMSKTEKTIFLLDNPDKQTLSQVGNFAHKIMELFTDVYRHM